MDFAPLTSYQIELINRPSNVKLFLEGPAGSGKTTVGIERMLALLQAGVPGSEILLLTPQRTLASSYLEALSAAGLPPGGQVSAVTVGGLARRMVELFWPLVAEEAGFARPDRPPAFLTLESALYYMAHLVRPLIDEGFFDSVTIDRNRIYSQIIDNLNKSAIVGFPYTEIGERLRSSWPDDTAQGHVYSDAQRCASLFREYCLANNLLDYSLQIEVFCRHLWPSLLCKEFLIRTYRHLIADNLEEDTPMAHDILREWLPRFESALLVYDQEAGYRRFLGADPDSAHTMTELCDEHHVFESSLVTTPVVETFCTLMGHALERYEPDTPVHVERPVPLHLAINLPPRPLRFFPQMLDWVTEQVECLVREGTPPGEIVLLAPLLPDSLRFALTYRLEQREIPYRTHRPSRSLREEPAIQALLALAALAHPAWGIRPSSFEMAYALVQTISGLDLVRAQLLIDAAYRAQDGHPTLLPFQKIRPDTQQRITFQAGERYEHLRLWLEDYVAEPAEELDFFFSRLFGEVLSQPGFAFHSNFEAGGIAANLIESAQKFRWSVEGRQVATLRPEDDQPALGSEYLRMIHEGVLSAQYVLSWQIPPGNAVLVAPAYTFLLANQPVDHQFWLDAGSSAWAERINQPLTHPHVLSRAWQVGRAWTDVEEFEYNRDALYRLVLGLARRCRKQVHIGHSDLGESGFESRGMLLRALSTALTLARGEAP
jgi:hypothetical protein